MKQRRPVYALFSHSLERGADMPFFVMTSKEDTSFVSAFLVMRTWEKLEAASHVFLDSFPTTTSVDLTLTFLFNT